MKNLFNPTTLRVVALPILGAVGALFAIAWPVGHHAFCAGLEALVV